jgi:hypothetical protein
MQGDRGAVPEVEGPHDHLHISQVSASDFGQQFDARLDRSLYAQPLVVGGEVIATAET